MHTDLGSEGDDVVLTVSGAIDLSTLDELRRCLARAEERTRPGRELRLDLRGTTFISAAGIGEVGVTARVLLERGARLRVLPSPAIGRIIALLRAAGRLPTGFDVEG